MANQTASRLYSYDEHSFDRTIDTWVQALHRENCKVNGWSCTPLKRGAFGYDNLVYSICKVSEAHSDGVDITDVETVSDLIHEGWVANYTYWRDNKPWLSAEGYTKPSQSLGDERREECARMKYVDLPSEEKVKDRILAKFIISDMFFPV